MVSEEIVFDHPKLIIGTIAVDHTQNTDFSRDVLLTYA